MKALLFGAGLMLTSVAALAEPLGLPEVPIPADNPQSEAKIALGDRLFNETRFSTTGEISCSSCHVEKTAFTDSPLRTSEGINKLKGTRNAPTVINAAYNETQFWDGRSPDLEDQALHPFINPLEMGQPTHDPLLETVRGDREYRRAFREVFGVRAADITMAHITKAIAAFERTRIAGDSPFDRWYFNGEAAAVSEAAKRGFQVFLADGRCVSCHTIEQNFAIFTDHQFHNIGVGINGIQDKVPQLARAFQRAKAQGAEVDVAVLADEDTSHLGRFAVDDELSSMGAFKTSTLRNIAATPPYMHDGSIATLREVVEHYNNGGATNADDKVNPFISGGIRPLDLTEQQIDDLVAFMESLTSPESDGLLRQHGGHRQPGSGTMSNRRDFLKVTSGGLIAGMLPVSLVRLASAADEAPDFTFAYISDSHIQQIKGKEFVRNWDRGLIRSVAEANLLEPKPDFIVFGGDLAQLGSKPELDHGAEILAGLNQKPYMVMGEHDYYLDLGEYWSELYGDHYYSWDHKGVHFVTLNSILTYDEWTFDRWETDERRMAEMAGLDNPNGSPFMVGEKQLKWLKKDLSKIPKDTPIVVFSHSPLQKIYKGWNFWTEDAEEVQALLRPFDKVNVIYGHVHQIQYNQIGNIAFTSVMSTAWPWPYPESYALDESHLPVLTVPMNRADPFNERDSTGWQFMNMHTGRVDLEFNLYDNSNRTVAFNETKGHPEDRSFDDPTVRTPAQSHF